MTNLSSPKCQGTSLLLGESENRNRNFNTFSLFPYCCVITEIHHRCSVSPVHRKTGSKKGSTIRNSPDIQTLLQLRVFRSTKVLPLMSWPYISVFRIFILTIHYYLLNCRSTEFKVKDFGIYVLLKTRFFCFTFQWKII